MNRRRFLTVLSLAAAVTVLGFGAGQILAHGHGGHHGGHHGGGHRGGGHHGGGHHGGHTGGHHGEGAAHVHHSSFVRPQGGGSQNPPPPEESHYHHDHDDYGDHHHDCRLADAVTDKVQKGPHAEMCQDHNGGWIID